MLHIILHFSAPMLIALLFFKNNLTKAYLIMITTMIVDIDHVLATPIYQPDRCSIGFHPLHQMWAICLYIVACFYKKTRLIGLGLVTHMLLDTIDCHTNTGKWFT